MKKISLAILSVIAALSFVFAAPQVVSAVGAPVDVFTTACSGNNAALCKSSTGSGLFGVIKIVIQVMLLIGGVIAVIMIILGGLRYMTSNGDQADVKSAKDTILYAIVGLVVAISGYSIVTWVVGNF